MSHKVRSGIIGLGNWGKKVAGELNAASDLVAFTSGTPSLHEMWLSAHLPKARHTSLARLMEDETIQIIAIVTPIPLLSTFARTAVNAGKHVFVEKPLARSSETASSLADLAERRGRILSTGYVFLYHPVYLELKHRLNLTSIRTVTIEWRKYGSFTEPIELSLLTHHLSLMLDLLGEPMSGTIHYGPGLYTDCDKIETQLRYPTLDVTSLIDRTSVQSTHRMTVETDGGSCLVWEDNLLSWIDENKKSIVIYDNKHPALAAEITGFVRAATSENPELPTAGPFAARVLRLLEGLRQVK
ncbi:MAG TPA: Gfo/Idh/MocA family oxidoreductase [Anaerolineales bacterium]|nr:Gfo/Idh/MocA family oxidoreductase [Anaerolineales bacterium]